MKNLISKFNQKFNLGYVLIFSILSLLAVSCQKNEEIENLPNEQSLIESSNNEPAFYYFDGLSVSEGSFNPEEESNHTLVLLKLDEAGQKYIEIHGFSTLENYFQYGNTHGMPLEGKYNIEQHLADYAVTSGAIAEYEQTGVEPQWYIDYVNNYINGSTSTTAQARVLCMMYDDCSATGSAWGFSKASATMLSGIWIDRVSSYTPLHVWGFDSFYKKMFFQKNSKLATFWNWGWQNYSFCHPALKFIDNKTRSWIGGL